MNLLHRHRIQKSLYHAKHGRKPPRRVDEIEFSETLRVVVLRDGRGLFDVAVDGTHAADTNTFEVHDGAAGFEQAAGFAGTGGEAGVGDFFVFNHQVLEHAFCSRDFVHGCQVDLAELFDVDWAAVLEKKISVATEGGGRGKQYLVGFVVVLGVVFEYFGFLDVVEVSDQVVDAKVLSPFLAVDEPRVCRGQYSSQISAHLLGVRYIFFESSTLNFRARRNRNCTIPR